jgi:branched-subunit amino acid transport protein AzlD
MISKARLLAIVNVAAYLLNTLETFGYGPFSSHFTPTQNNATISNKYQTIITPFGFAFSIWGLIFVMQAIYCYVINFWGVEYMNHPLVIDGVSYWYILACVAQTLWSPAFTYEKMPLAATFMGCILIPLIVIAYRQHMSYNKAMERNVRLSMYFRGKYYLLLQFPFELHLGWILAAFALNINVVLVANNVSSVVQVIAAVLSLGVLSLISIWCLFGKTLTNQTPNYTIPSVSIWTTFWIYVELHNPKTMIMETFSSTEINGFCYGSIGVFFGLIYCCVWKLAKD